MGRQRAGAGWATSLLPGVYEDPSRLAHLALLFGNF